MPLADDIRALRGRVLADLVDAHDYYAHTKAAWRIVHRAVVSGRVSKSRNVVTGTVTTPAELDAKAPGYVGKELAEATFQQFLAIFESFVGDLLRLWLTAHPRGLGKRTVDLKTVLDLPDKEAVAELIVGREVNDVLYRRPAEWFTYLEEQTGIGRPAAADIDRLAEAKATRDLLVHNQGVANKTYAAKAGHLARFRDGERIDISERYHRSVWELLCTMAADVSAAALAKAD